MPPVIWALAQESQQLGMRVSVAGLKDEFLEKDCSGVNVPMLAGAVSHPKGFGYSTELRRLLQDQDWSGGVIHSHGLWMHPSLLARKCSARTGSPLVISPHGMLEPWALNRSRIKKRIVWKLFEQRNITAAKCLHALCQPEAENFRRLGLRNPIAVIPNGVDLKTFDALPDYDAITERVPEARGKQRILFLSRIHPKKGLPNLLRAWRRMAEQYPDWCLLIAGPDEIGHQAELQTLTSELELNKSVTFMGPVYGEDKRRALAGADVFALPSFSEGFSVAILEAAAAGLPVLLTHQCNFDELAVAGGGVIVAPEEQQIETGLRQLLAMSKTQRKAMGQCGRALVSRAYTWPAIARQMLEVYEWLLGKGSIPTTVQLAKG